VQVGIFFPVLAFNSLPGPLS